MIPLDNETIFRPSINYRNDLGLLADVAKKVINEKSVDLVVIGSHKSNSLSRLLFASHTYSILDKLDCPVLIVPEGLRFKGIDTIAYATDLTFNNQKVIQYLVDIAKPFNANIAVNHISKPTPTLAKRDAMNLKYSSNEQAGSDHPTVFYHTIKREHVKAGLLEMTDAGRVDLLALVHKQYEFFEGLFHVSVSKQMADNVKVPLLVLPYSFSMDVADMTNDQLDHFCFEPSEFR